MAIRSMGPVDETTQTFAFDCYFRQFWTDPRLKFNSTTSLDQLAMNWAFLNKIWRPDTFIVNGKNSYLHKMTVPNRFIRISPSGRISYSQRLTLKARYAKSGGSSFRRLHLNLKGKYGHMGQAGQVFLSSFVRGLEFLAQRSVASVWFSYGAECSEL